MARNTAAATTDEAQAPAEPKTKAASTRISLERKALALLEGIEHKAADEAERALNIAERILGIAKNLKPEKADKPAAVAATTADPAVRVATGEQSIPGTAD